MVTMEEREGRGGSVACGIEEDEEMVSFEQNLSDFSTDQNSYSHCIRMCSGCFPRTMTHVKGAWLKVGVAS